MTARKKRTRAADCPLPLQQNTVPTIGTDEDVLRPILAELLEAIDEIGSVKEAAKKIGVSYSFAWTRLDIIEAAFKQRIILRSQGGKNGGGAVLTDFGKELLRRYNGFSADVDAAADAAWKHWFGDMKLRKIPRAR